MWIIASGSSSSSPTVFSLARSFPDAISIKKGSVCSRILCFSCSIVIVTCFQSPGRLIDNDFESIGSRHG